MEQDRTNGRPGPVTARNGNGGSSDDETRPEVITSLRDLGQRVAPHEISEVWVFPPLPHLEGSSEFLLFTRLLPDEMRYLCGAEFSSGNGNGNGNGQATTVHDRVRRITEYGAVPSHRVSRLVAGFRDRLGEHREPLHFEIAGSEDCWTRLVEAEAAPPGD